MDVDDAAAKRVHELSGVDPVIAGVDDKLDAVIHEETEHGGIAFFDRSEALLRQLPQREAALAGESGSRARRPVRCHRDHIEAAIDQVAQVRPLAGHDDAELELQRTTTRSGPS